MDKVIQPEVVRSHKKDDQYIEQIICDLDDIISSFMGQNFRVKWSEIIRTAGNLIYFASTTGLCLQTLGEEYVNMIPVDSNFNIPASWKRFGYATLQSLFPHLSTYLISKLERSILTQMFLFKRLDQRKREYCLLACDLIKTLSEALQTFNLALFFIGGQYYHLAKRIFQIDYVKVRPGKGHISVNIYRLVGWLTIIKLILRYWFKLSALRMKIRKEMSEASLINTSHADELTDCAIKCRICLGPRHYPSAATCGHVFCWSCIINWCQTNPVCPICRIDCEPNRVILLYNYV